MRKWGEILVRAEPILFMTPGMIIVLLVTLVPLILGVSYSFYHMVLFEPDKTGYIGFANYMKLWGDLKFWHAFVNTVRWTGWSIAFQFLLGLGLALLLTEKFYGRRLYQALVFLPWAVPLFLSGFMWAWMLNPMVGPIPHILFDIGVMNKPESILSDPKTSIWGPIIANIWWGIPFFAITMLAALQAIPRELYETASIDGATQVQQFRYVTLPLISPMIIMTILLRTVWVANLPDLIYVMTGGGPANSSEIVSSYIFTTAYSKLDFGYASTISSILLLFLLFYATILMLMRRRLLK